MTALRVLLLALVATALPACVERKIFIRSDPPGAEVTLNREETLEGATPVEVPFSFYGAYAVRLTREGYRDLEAVAEVDPPWWSWPPFDIVTEFLLPVTIEDHREFTYRMEPLAPPLTAEESRARNRKLIERGEELRRQVKEGNAGEAR